MDALFCIICVRTYLQSTCYNTVAENDTWDDTGIPYPVFRLIYD